MKVFFVKYNDPIYVKLEKLDIMIRLTNQGNIAQVLAELKEWVSYIHLCFAYLFACCCCFVLFWLALKYPYWVIVWTSPVDS